MELNEVQRAAQQQFARQSQHYGQGHILENVSDVREAFHHIHLRPPAMALDVATGGGHTGLFLASLGYDVTVSDIAQPMLDRAAETARTRGFAVATRLHTAEEFPYPDQTFDLVTCRIAAHHFSSPAAFVHETGRVLRSGGWFLLIDSTVEDDQKEAEEWMHAIEKLRDPSHHRNVTPRLWKSYCADSGLAVRHLAITSYKQPDLNWYFDAAATSPENRRQVLELVTSATASVRQLFRLTEEDGKIVWFWQRITLVAQKSSI